MRRAGVMPLAAPVPLQGEAVRQSGLYRPHRYQTLPTCMPERVARGELTVHLLRACHAQAEAAPQIRYLASGGSLHDLHYNFCIGRSTAGEIVRKVCQTIWDTMKEECIPIPTEEAWAGCSAGFWERANFPNCLGAVDGKHIRIVKPLQSGSLYQNYKHYFYRPIGGVLRPQPLLLSLGGQGMFLCHWLVKCLHSMMADRCLRGQGLLWSQGAAGFKAGREELPRRPDVEFSSRIACSLLKLIAALLPTHLSEDPDYLFLTWLSTLMILFFPFWCLYDLMLRCLYAVVRPS
uniref:DDE Tnp4 domain-containing protein n=1 Tax=Leptobrachium leishanense TaxID=445787 RepID=A0A8C5PLR9_9ANUR